MAQNQKGGNVNKKTVLYQTASLLWKSIPCTWTTNWGTRSKKKYASTSAIKQHHSKVWFSARIHTQLRKYQGFVWVFHKNGVWDLKRVVMLAHSLSRNMHPPISVNIQMIILLVVISDYSLMFMALLKILGTNHLLLCFLQ